MGSVRFGGSWGGGGLVGRDEGEGDGEGESGNMTRCWMERMWVDDHGLPWCEGLN